MRGFSLFEDFMSGVSKIALSESCVLSQVAAIYTNCLSKPSRLLAQST